jgi:hypothetical protein
MTVKIVLIGGRGDGRRIELPENDRNFRLPVQDGGNFDYEEYLIERITGDGVSYSVGRCASLSINEMLARLIGKYPETQS